MNLEVVTNSIGQLVLSYGLFTRVSGFLPAALKLWCKHNQFLPQAIIVYRDGVGDGQLQALMDHEVPQIESSLRSVYPKDSGYINCKVQIV